MKIFLVLAMLTAMAAIALTATTPVPSKEARRRFHLLRRPYNNRAANAFAMTACDKNPRVCRGKGSPGPDCCKKKCVDVTKDRFNCGECGKKCKFGRICCRGECVKVMSDKKHCGWCDNKCEKGSSCTYGMCSYA